MKNRNEDNRESFIIQTFLIFFVVAILHYHVKNVK